MIFNTLAELKEFCGEVSPECMEKLKKLSLMKDAGVISELEFGRMGTHELYRFVGYLVGYLVVEDEREGSGKLVK